MPYPLKRIGSNTMKMNRILAPIAVLAPMALVSTLFGSWGMGGPQPRKQDMAGAKLRRELKDKAADFWIYDDLKAAKAELVRTQKPLLLSLRCVP